MSDTRETTKEVSSGVLNGISGVAAAVVADELVALTVLAPAAGIVAATVGGAVVYALDHGIVTTAAPAEGVLTESAYSVASPLNDPIVMQTVASNDGDRLDPSVLPEVTGGLDVPVNRIDTSALHLGSEGTSISDSNLGMPSDSPFQPYSGPTESFSTPHAGTICALPAGPPYYTGPTESFPTPHAGIICALPAGGELTLGTSDGSISPGIDSL